MQTTVTVLLGAAVAGGLRGSGGCVICVPFPASPVMLGAFQGTVCAMQSDGVPHADLVNLVVLLEVL